MTDHRWWFAGKSVSDRHKTVSQNRRSKGHKSSYARKIYTQAFGHMCVRIEVCNDIQIEGYIFSESFKPREQEQRA